MLPGGRPQLIECKHKVFTLTNGLRCVKYLYGGVIENKQAYYVVNFMKCAISLCLITYVVLGSMTGDCQGLDYGSPLNYNRFFWAKKHLNKSNNYFRKDLNRFQPVFSIFGIIIFIIFRKAMCFCLHIGAKQLQQLATAGNSAHSQAAWRVYKGQGNAKKSDLAEQVQQKDVLM